MEQFEERWVIDISFDNEEDALKALDGIEEKLVELGEIGTIHFYSEDIEKPICKLCNGTGWQQVFDPIMFNNITVACRGCR